MESVRVLKEFIEKENPKFTPAQKKLVDVFMKGKILINVNAHRMNGGTLMFINSDNDLNSLEYAGRIYKAYQRFFWKIEKFLKENYDGKDPFLSSLIDVKVDSRGSAI